MAISTDRLFVPPEVEVECFGFQERAHHLQRAGWKFEAMESYCSRDNPFGRERQMIMRHPSGLTVMASCREEDLIYAVRTASQYGPAMRSECRPVFRAQRVTAKASEMHFRGPLRAHEYVVTSLDMETYPRALSARQVYSVNLADIYSCEAQEIIVEPKTVMSLLDEIKKLQAPELAAIRAKNRLRDPTRHLQDQPAPEWHEEVSAQIITMRRAA